MLFAHVVTLANDANVMAAVDPNNHGSQLGRPARASGSADAAAAASAATANTDATLIRLSDGESFTVECKTVHACARPDASKKASGSYPVQCGGNKTFSASAAYFAVLWKLDVPAVTEFSSPDEFLERCGSWCFPTRPSTGETQAPRRSQAVLVPRKAHGRGVGPR